MDKTAQIPIEDELFEAILPWLEKAYPEEGCGLILEPEEGDRHFRPCKNVIDRYHALDPEQYPRTARDFYMIDPREFMAADERGDQVRAIVHSHPDAGAYFSDSDVSAALMPAEEGEDVEPIYEGVDYLVVSVRDGRAREAALFRFERETAQFDERRRWSTSALEQIFNRKGEPQGADR